jgi:hypothetical protein
MYQCEKCGSTYLDSGYIMTEWLSGGDSKYASYASYNNKSYFIKQMKILALTCLSCGHIDIGLDTEQLENLKKVIK